MERLVQYDWPGNVRELVNVIERAVCFADTDTVEVRDLPDHVASRTGSKSSFVSADTRIDPAPASPAPSSEANGATFKDAKERWVSVFERDYILALLDRNESNISHAAREADIDRKYFRKLMKKYGIGAYGDDADSESED